MAESLQSPFRETIHRVGQAAGAKMLHMAEAGRLRQELAGEAGVIVVRGSRSGAGATFLVDAVIGGGQWPVVWVEGGVENGWRGLRVAASSAGSAATVVPALFGRLLASVVRGGLLPSTDPEVVAMQLEKDSVKVLDFAAGTPMSRWLLAQSGAVAPALSRRLRALGLPHAEALVASMMSWAGLQADGQKTGWNLPGKDDEEAVRNLALAAGACGMSMVWIFDSLDAMAFRPDSAHMLWQMAATLTSAGNRTVLVCSEETWSNVLDKGLPGGWRDRLAGRTVRVKPMAPSLLKCLLADRLAMAGKEAAGLPDVIVGSALPMGGTPREALEEAGVVWSMMQARPLEPVPSRKPVMAVEPELPAQWVEGLQVAGSVLPFIDASPVAARLRTRGLLWQSPGLWALLVGPEALAPELVESVTREARALAGGAPPDTRVQIVVLLAADGETAALPPGWNAVVLDERERDGLDKLPGLPPGSERMAAMSALSGLWERLTRPGHAVA